MSDARAHKRRRLRWAFGATLIALALWGVLSLSQDYSWDINVPLEVRIDTTEETLAESIPRFIRVTARGDGWTLMQIALGRDLLCRISPSEQPAVSDDSTRIYTFSERDLLTNIVNVPATVRLEDAAPRGLRLVVTDIASKTVPLYYPAFSIDTREGFQVIGTPRVWPDSVRLSGPAETLEKITRWYTSPLNLSDVFQPVRTSVPVNDSLYGVITISPDRAQVQVEVQEIAEVTFENLPVINRGTAGDTTIRLLLYPQRVTVTLRGGAADLGRLSEGDVVPYIQLIQGIDTTGFVRPTISLPTQGNASVINITPERIRYVWRKTVSSL